MSEEQTLRFGQETWQKGHRGLMHPANTDRPLMRNMLVWDDGSVGPRPMWQDDSFTLASKFTIDTKIVVCDIRVGETIVPGILAATGTDDDFYQLDGTLYANIHVGAPTTLVDITREHTASFGPDDFVFIGNVHYSMTCPDGAFDPWYFRTRADPSAFKKSTGTLQDDEYRSVYHQGRVFYWFTEEITGTLSDGDGGSAAGTEILGPTRLAYSDAYDFDSFTSASQFFDVDFEIGGCVSVGSNLMIWGINGEWAMMSGRGDPAVATLISLGRGRIPGRDRQPARLDRRAVFLSSDGQSVCTIDEGGNIDDTELADLGHSDTARAYDATNVAPSAAASSIYNTVSIPNTDSFARHLNNGVWSDEEWDVTLSNDDFQVGVSETAAKEVLARWNTGTSRWNIFTRDISLDEPNLVANSYVESDEDGRLHVPRLYRPEKQVRVDRVIIDARTWESDGTTHPFAEVAVQVSDGKSDDHTLTLGPAADPLSGVPDEDNRAVRITATPDNVLPYTSFSDVKIYNVQGVVIEAVSVELKISDGPIQ